MAKDPIIYVENARKIIRQYGSCEGVHCYACPMGLSNNCDKPRKAKVVLCKKYIEAYTRKSQNHIKAILNI